MSSAFSVLFFPFKLLFAAEPNSFMRGLALLLCIVWSLFLFSLGHAAWQAIPVVWAFIVWVAKGLWAAYQWVMHWIVPPAAVIQILSSAAFESKITAQTQCQFHDLKSWFLERLNSRTEEADQRSIDEIARLREALAQIEVRIAKLEPVSHEAIQSMDGVMQQFMKGGSA